MTQELPFTALYTFALRSWISRLSDLELRVLLLLCTYVDGFGICFPGIAELSEKAGLAEKYVRTALDGLVRKRLIVRLADVEPDPQKRQALRGRYALSSELIRNKSVIQNQNQNQEPKSVNQNQEPPPPTTSKASLENWKRPSSDSASDPQKTMHDFPVKNASSAANTTKPARSATSGADASRTSTPPFSPSPPESDEHKSLSRYHEPMPEADDEALANELYSSIREISIVVARRLVAKHGHAKVRTALIHLGRQPAGNIRTPAGWLIDQLEKSAFVPDKDGEQKENKAGYGGAYAEFINH